MSQILHFTLKRQGHISISRALNCTRDMACGHIDELATELQEAGIITNAEQISPGKWKGDIDLTRVFNHDRTNTS